MMNSSRLLKTALVLACAVIAPACGSDDGGGGGNAVAEANTANGQALAVANQSVIVALSAPTALKFAAIETQIVQCTPDGDATVTGDVTSETDSTSFDLDIDYDLCSGGDLDGLLTAEGSAVLDNATLTYNYVFNGNLEGTTCNLTYTDLEVTIDTTGAAFIDGLLDAECDSGAVSCNYIDVNLTDQDALTAACD